MTRGRHPETDAQRAAKGLPPRGKMPQFTPGADAPDWLDSVAREIWERCAPELTQHGLLSVADGETLANYCVACSTCKSLAEKLQDPALDVKDKLKMVRLLLASMATASSLAQQFGFTPVSRPKLQVADSPVDELEEFLTTSSEGSKT